MKTILYNPIFINPQAYYVFPRLTRWLRPDDSYKEPANYIGQIEVTIIAYGEIGYTEYFEHTNYIDFTNFSNSYVRISLFTRLGACVLGEWKIGTMEGDRPYIEPEVLASLKAVVIVGDKTNQDKDRDIVANLVDASNPFIISNAAYKLNSGYGKYEEDFTSWDRIDASTVEISNDGSKIKCINTTLNVQYLFNSINKDIPSFQVKISNFTKGNIVYYYRKEDGTEAFLRIEPSPLDKVLELPKSYNTVEGGTGSRGGFYSSNINIGVTIEQIPSYQGAFVTDGVDDLITSTKTVQDMLGGSNEITVVSMMCQIGDTIESFNRNNWLLTPTSYLESRVEKEKTGKTGIYGYTSTDINNGQISNINSILGDKNDYTANSKIESTGLNFFSVEGFQNEGIWYTSSVAWYWTIIANKVLTTDQINQVIAYYNLDRTLKPDILCNTIKQGITNENHAEFGDKLIDFSGNGRDIQLNNIAWKLDSGIGKYEVDFSTWSGSGIVIGNGVGFKIEKETIGWWGMYAYGDTSGLGSFTIKVTNCHDPFVYRYKDEDGNWKNYLIESDGIYTLPASGAKDDKDNYRFFNSNPNATYNGLTVEQIPSHAGALCFDGVEDYGKVTGLPIYKDYTVVADYERFNIGNIEGVGTSPVLSKSYTARQGSFIMNFIASTGNSIRSYSFGTENTSNFNDLARQIFYQSKYKNQGFDITAGTGVDGDSLWLGTARDNDSRFFNGAIYSLMTFPYSMSEFLIERQLKKHKLGTLYPDMVEFRPIVNSNVEWNTIEIWQADKPLYRPAIGTNETGTYLQKDSTIGIYVKPKGVDEVTKIVVNGTEYTNLKINSNGFYYVTLPITKSPQKIDITIDEYIRYEDIVQPYPAIVTLKQDGKDITWGDKLKVGDEVTFVTHTNLLPNLYTVSGGMYYNGKFMYGNTPITVAKSMTFTTVHNYIKSNEPKCILSPSRLRIPNSSYKILGYIPDISGHGNHGVIHNSAYAEGSGVNADGSYQLDGVDDFITIPTTVGGKQVLMKVNWQSSIGQGMLYDQRGTAFAIWNSNKYNDDETDTIPAYSARNGGNTYIDGILNKNILASQLRNITHNIVATNTMLNGSSVSPTIGCRTEHDAYFTNMSLYDFMLFDEIDSDEEILTLNEYVGIEGNTDDLFN